MSSFELSSYQKAILNYIQFEQGNLLVDAKAGSGKTSTLILIAENIIKQNKKCLFLAFNKSIVDELQTKIKNDNCQIKTIHALGLGFIRSYLYKKWGKDYKLDIINEKVRNLVKKYFESICAQDFEQANLDMDEEGLKDLYASIINELCQLVNFARFYNIDYHKEQAVISLMFKHSRELKNYDEIGMDNFPKIISSVIDEIKQNFENPEIINGIPNYYIDFTDMIYFPAYYKMSVPFNIKEYLDYILIDESQDLSNLQQYFLKLLDTGNTRYIFVGDEKQAIYGFAGADTKSIQTIKKNFKLEELPLNICYRCPKKVIQLAQTLVPSIEWNKDRLDEGTVKFIGNDSYIDMLKPGDVILGRKNRDLIKLYKHLVLDKKFPVKFKNKDLVNTLIKQLTSIMQEYIRRYNRCENVDVKLHKFLKENDIPEKIKNRTTEQQDFVNKAIKKFIDEEKCLNKQIVKSNHSVDYLVKCMQEFKNKGEYQFLSDDELVEFYDIILSFIAEFKKTTPLIGLKTFIDYLNNFLSGNLSKDVPIISTIHMMKGGEADNIFILDYPMFPYSFKGQNEDDHRQESNLQYVAITRAKKNLYLCLLDDEGLGDLVNKNQESQRIVGNALRQNSFGKDVI